MLDPNTETDIYKHLQHSKMNPTFPLSPKGELKYARWPFSV